VLCFGFRFFAAQYAVLVATDGVRGIKADDRMKKAGIAIGLAVFMLVTREEAVGASRERRIVARVDETTVVLKRRTLAINAIGMGRTPSAMGRAGQIIRRGPAGVLNKEGLLEYELVFNGVPNYTGFKLKPIKASFKERSVPDGVKGVRIFGEFNQRDALLPESKKRKSLLPFGGKRQKENSDETAGSITGPTPHQ
jgi:hypothetical protein